MGNTYSIMCEDCKIVFYLGNENVWWQDKELMYCLKDFLLAHTDHPLKIGGSEWNCAYDYYDKNGKMTDGQQLPTRDYIEYDSTY